MKSVQGPKEGHLAGRCNRERTLVCRANHTKAVGVLLPVAAPQRCGWGFPFLIRTGEGHAQHTRPLILCKSLFHEQAYTNKRGHPVTHMVRVGTQVHHMPIRQHVFASTREDGANTPTKLLNQQCIQQAQTRAHHKMVTTSLFPQQHRNTEHERNRVASRQEKRN